MDIGDSKILLLGAGKMGSALLAAWQKAGVKSISVVEPNTSFTANSAKVLRSIGDVTDTPDVIVIAVKPQSLDALMPELAASSRRRTGSHATPLYLSIAAGKTIGYFEKHLGDAAIVRAMPNMPALIGKGISAVSANEKVSEQQKELAASLLKAAGEVVWIKDESLMDVVTAVSGSGPAYVFLFMEALIQVGIAQGLPQDIAKKLTVETVHGAAELARKSGESLEQLRKNVTSPGGTTEAALKVLMKKDGLEALINDAVAEAVKRSKELA